MQNFVCDGQAHNPSLQCETALPETPPAPHCETPLPKTPPAEIPPPCETLEANMRERGDKFG